MILGAHTVEVLRPTTTEDEYGNDIKTYPASGTVVTGCSVQPVEGDEATVNRDTVVSRWRVYAPPTTDLEATDRVRFAGDVYDVDGEVQRWDFPPLGHLTALLRRS